MPRPAGRSLDVPSIDVWLLRLGNASVWLLTGALVLHAGYREIGRAYLDRLGLPVELMFVMCVLEIVLGVRVLRGPMTRPLATLLIALVLGFTAVLARMDPMLLVHPFGVLTKNVPLLATVVVAARVDGRGWTAHDDRLLRFGLAAVWLTEGLLPKIFFQQPMELAVVERSGLVPMDPRAFLVAMGVCEALSGIFLLALSGPPIRVVLTAQLVGLVVLPALVSWHEPDLWVHPFGPLTKNLPIIAGTIVALRQRRSM